MEGFQHDFSFLADARPDDESVDEHMGVAGSGDGDTGSGSGAVVPAGADFGFLQDDEDVEGMELGEGAGEGAAGDAPAEEEEEEEAAATAEVEDTSPWVEEDAPEHACAYCLVSDPAKVVKCVSTGKWFCNGTLGLSSSSHIIFHLVKSGKTAVRLHPESPLGDTVLECYHCGDTNVLTLGFVAAAEDSVVVLVCRRCLQSRAGRDAGWRQDGWEALVQERELVSWLVAPPTAAEEARSRKLKSKVATQLETQWRSDPRARLADVQAARQEPALAPAQAQYDDGYEFQRVLAPMVEAEADHNRALTEGQSVSGASVQWSHLLNGRYVASVSLPALTHQLRIIPGAVARLSFTAAASGRWEGRGTVTAVRDGVVDMLMDTARVPTNVTLGFALEMVWQDVAFRRMQSALRRFAEDDNCTDPGLYHAVLGQSVTATALPVRVPRSADVPGLAQLNHSQEAALRAVIRQPLALVQGPPGTGKTVTAAAIVYHLCQNKTAGRILVTAPSNVAVDHLAEKINRVGVKVVRVLARARENVASQVEHLCLHSIVGELAGTDTALGRLISLRNAEGELNAADDSTYRRLLKRTEDKILAAADVICTTCSAAADTRIARFDFRHVLVDEATQATEPDILVPIVRGARQLILIGDHCQLGPVVLSKVAQRAGLGRSLFERFVASGTRPVRLEVQYRMHPCLSAFPSATFYEGALQDGVTAADRTRPAVEFPWPNPEKPMMFWSSLSHEELSSSGTSYVNRAEASLVERVVTLLLGQGVPATQIGVITPYTGQCAFIADTLTAGGLSADAYTGVEVASVDSFQGREKDYIVLSCVRSNEKLGIGFLSDPRRLNVALTRARFGLVTIGNPTVLATSPLWSALLAHFRANDTLVEGPITALRACTVALPRPRPVDPSRPLHFPGSANAPVNASLHVSLPRFPGDLPSTPAPFMGTADPFAAFGGSRRGAARGQPQYNAFPQAAPTGGGLHNTYGYVPFQAGGRGAADLHGDDAASVSGASVGGESSMSHPSVMSAAVGHGAGVPRSFM